MARRHHVGQCWRSLSSSVALFTEDKQFPAHLLSLLPAEMTSLIRLLPSARRGHKTLWWWRLFSTSLSVVNYELYSLSQSSVCVWGGETNTDVMRDMKTLRLSLCVIFVFLWWTTVMNTWQLSHIFITSIQLQSLNAALIEIEGELNWFKFMVLMETFQILRYLELIRRNAPLKTHIFSKIWLLLVSYSVVSCLR